MAPKPAPKKSVPKPPRSHIVKQESEEAFLKEVSELMEKGFRPIQDMKMFAAYDRKREKWRTLYIMPLVHIEEFRAFQTVPETPHGEAERMFG